MGLSIVMKWQSVKDFGGECCGTLSSALRSEALTNGAADLTLNPVSPIKSAFLKLYSLLEL